MSDIPGIEAEIAQHRADLADTVDQLADQVAQAKSTAIRNAAVAGGVIVVGFVALKIVQRLRS